MDQEPFRARVVRLLQRSRQAYRLYSTLGRTSKDENGKFSESQANEWRQVNAHLARELAQALDDPNAKLLVSRVQFLREMFLENFRTTESELRKLQTELVSAAERADFGKAAVLAERLVPLKAKVEASRAAYNEIDSLTAHPRAGGVRSESGALPAETGADEAANDLGSSRSPDPIRRGKSTLAPVIPLRSRSRR